MQRAIEECRQTSNGKGYPRTGSRRIRPHWIAISLLSVTQHQFCKRRERKNVIGWLIIFATATFTSGFWGSSAHEPGALLASGIFGALFLLALGAKAVRGPVC